MEHRVEAVSRHRLDEHVDVVGHDAPRQKPIPFAVEMQQGVFDEFGDAPILQMAGTVSLIQPLRDALFACRLSVRLAPPRKLLRPAIQDALRQGIGKAKRDGLNQARAVDVGQVVPTAPCVFKKRQARRLRSQCRRPRLGIHRRLARELGRDLDHRLVDQHRHRVEVAGESFQPEPLRLQRQRPATGEGVVEGGELVAVEELLRARVVGVLGTGAPPALPDFVPRRLQDLLVGGVFPQHQILDDLEEPLALLLLAFRGREQVGVRRGVVHHLREDHRPRRRQRPPRPPQVQRARVAVADGLLPRAGLVDGVERQRDLDELLRVLHIAPFAPFTRNGAQWKPLIDRHLRL